MIFKVIALFHKKTVKLPGSKLNGNRKIKKLNVLHIKCVVGLTRKQNIYGNIGYMGMPFVVNAFVLFNKSWNDLSTVVSPLIFFYFCRLKFARQQHLRDVRELNKFRKNWRMFLLKVEIKLLKMYSLQWMYSKK